MAVVALEGISAFSIALQKSSFTLSARKLRFQAKVQVVHLSVMTLLPLVTVLLLVIFLSNSVPKTLLADILPEGQSYAKKQ
jgi:hypothetical protein